MGASGTATSTDLVLGDLDLAFSHLDHLPRPAPARTSGTYSMATNKTMVARKNWAEAMLKTELRNR